MTRLRRVSCSAPGLARRRRGKGFEYVDAGGRKVTDPATLKDMTDGELFYIIKNGIRFTGMPGWGGEDEDNWKLVLFIRHLPQLSGQELELMKEVNGQGPQ